MTTTDSHADTRLFDSLVARGDTSGLSHSDRLAYYMKLCADLGLNPAAQPFAYLKLNGKDVLYATRGATDQLAAIHKLNREIIDGPKVIDLAGTKLVYAVCRATHPNGRVETATATVPLVDPANVYMKCETKAKRRATLSILGLGILDETEIETIPAAARETPASRPTGSGPAWLATYKARVSEAQTVTAIRGYYLSVMGDARAAGDDPAEYLSAIYASAVAAFTSLGLTLSRDTCRVLLSVGEQGATDAAWLDAMLAEPREGLPQWWASHSTEDHGLRDALARYYSQVTETTASETTRAKKAFAAAVRAVTQPEASAAADAPAEAGLEPVTPLSALVARLSLKGSIPELINSWKAHRHELDAPMRRAYAERLAEMTGMSVERAGLSLEQEKVVSK